MPSKYGNRKSLSFGSTQNNNASKFPAPAPTNPSIASPTNCPWWHCGQCSPQHTTLIIVSSVIMVFYVIMVTFLVTLFMNKFTSIVIPINLLFIQMSIIETKLITSKVGTISSQSFVGEGKKSI